MPTLFRHLLRLFSTSASPTGTNAGDVWWRNDLSQMHSSDGNPSPLIMGPSGNIPVVRSTGWHTVPTWGLAGSVAIPDQRAFAIPVWPGRSTTLTAVAINVTLALVGGTVRIGLYGSDGSVPTSLVADYGTVGTGVIGVQQISGLSTPLRPSLYFVVVVRQGGLLTLNLSTHNTGDPLISDTAPIPGINTNTYFVDGISGPLPASFGAISGTVQGPSIALQLT